MKTGIVIFGVFLIVGAIADQVVVPELMSSVNDHTDSIQMNAMSGLPEEIQTSLSFTSASTEMNAGIDPLHTQLTTMEHFIQIGSIIMGVAGIGFVIFGVAKNDKRLYQKTQDMALEILKKRLAQGEISRTDFNNLKYDIP